MRILMLNNEFPPLGGGQGVVHSVLLQQFLKTSDLHVDSVVGVPFANNVTPPPGIRVFPICLHSKNIHHSSNTELLRFLVLGSVQAVKLCRKNRYDLVLAFSAVPAGAQALLLRLIFGIPYVVRSPGVDIPGFEARYQRIYSLLSPLIRLIWRASRKLIVSSETHRVLIERSFPPNASKTVVICNGVDLAQFHPDSAPLHQFTILCVARLIERKGIEHLLKAVQSLVSSGSAVRLALVGIGDNYEKLRSLAAELQISPHVEFLGAVKRSEISQIYNQASVFVLPSLNEGMSNAALEALASGLPIIMTNVGGAAELVEPGVNGFIVKDGDSEELAFRLKVLRDDPELCSAMGRASRERSKAFEWGEIAEQYRRMLMNVINAE